MRFAYRRSAADSRGGVGIHQLFGRCRGARASGGMDGAHHPFAGRIPFGAESISSDRRVPDGNLSCDCRGGAVADSARRRIRDRSDPPGHHLPCKHGIGISNAACWPQSTDVVLPVPKTGGGGSASSAAGGRGHERGSAAHHLSSFLDYILAELAWPLGFKRKRRPGLENRDALFWIEILG